MEYFELEWTNKDHQSPALKWIAHTWLNPWPWHYQHLALISWTTVDKEQNLDIICIIPMLCLIKYNLIWITRLSYFSREPGVFAWCFVRALVKQSVCKTPCRGNGRDMVWENTAVLDVWQLLFGYWLLLCALICVCWSTRARQKEAGLPGCWAGDGCTACAPAAPGSPWNVQEGRHSLRGSPQQLLCCSCRGCTGWAICFYVGGDRDGFLCSSKIVLKLLINQRRKVDPKPRIIMHNYQNLSFP